MQKKHTRKAQMIVFMILFTLAVMGTASAADNSSNNQTTVNYAQVQSTHISTTKNITINTTKLSNNTAKDPQIWNGGVPVSRGGQPAGYNWVTIQNAINNALPGDTIMLENGAIFNGIGNTQITLTKNLNFDVLDGGTATIDGGGTRWGFVVNNGFTAVFNHITFQNMFTILSGGAIENNGGTVTLNNCILRNNQAVIDGGAIFNHNNGNLYVNYCSIYNNRAGAGSGIYTTDSGTVNIANNIIYSNVNGDGTGITVDSGNPTITGNDIYGNYWRGIYVGSGNAVISNNYIHNNGHATRSGDGINIGGGNPIITGNNIRNNAEDGIHVNGLLSGSSSNPLQIHYNSIVDNGEWGLHVTNGGYVNAIHNWWGTNTPNYIRQLLDPSYPRDIFEQRLSSSSQRVSWNPYLYLRISANTPIYNGDTSTVTADLTRDNNNNIAPGTVPNGTIVTFSLTNGPYGSLTAPLIRSTTAGVASIIFTANDPNAPHTQSVRAVVDHQQVNTNIDINPKAQVVMTKTNNGPVYVGQTGTFTVTLTNNGPNAATNIQVTDPFITGFTYTPSIGNYDPATGIWTINTLANGATATLTITKNIMAPTDAGTISNTATETQTTYNPTPITPKTTNLQVNPVAHVTMTKTNNGPVYVGQTGTFTVTLTNNGPNAATNIQVTDPFITGFTYTPSTGNYDPATGIWTINTLANGATATLTITKNIMAPTDAGTISNTATETQTTYNPTPITPKTTNLQVNPVAHVTMTKTNNGPVYVGQTGTFTVTLTNNGPNAATNIQVTDPFITGFTYTPSTGNYDPATGIWTINTLANGATATLTITKNIMAPTDAGTIPNTATETQTTYNPTPITPKTTNLQVNPVAHVTMTKTGNGPLNVGHTGTFTITITNHGPNDAQNVQVADAIPSGFTLGSFSMGTYDGNVWTIPLLANGASATLTFNRVMTADDAGTTKTNTATETQTTYNPTPITPQTANIYVNNAMLSIKKTTDKSKYNIGNSVIYNIDITNNGPNTATNLIVTDTLQSGLTYVSSTLGGSYNALTRTITWNLPSLASGLHFLPSFTAIVDSGTQGQTIKNIVSAHSDQVITPVESTPANININKAVLSIKKTTDKPKYNVGNSVIYNIDLTNNGPDTATNLIVTDTLPDGLTYVSSTKGGVWDPATRTITWNLDNLASGSHFIVTVTSTIDAQGGKTLVNTVVAKDDQMDDAVSTTASIYVKKCQLFVKVNPTLIKTIVGKTFTITYKVGNMGPDEANDVIMTFVIPDGLEFVSASSPDSAQPTYDAATKTLTWILGDVQVGDPLLKLNLKALRAGTFLISSTLVTSTSTSEPVIVSAVTVKAQNKVDPHGKTVPMQNTGAPIGVLILAGLMVLGGMILPKRKN